MNSSKSNDKLSLNNNHLHKSDNESCNGLPKITSTPLHSVGVRRPSPFSSVTKSRLLGPRRYSLSDISSINGTSPTKHDSSDLGAGPLLTSINYRDNISVYEETKSTGLAGRIVRYNEETERRKPIVQEKYNGVGLFPIVHLFKNRSNSEEPPKRTFIKIGTPDRIKCLPPPSREISKKMLEEITKPSHAKLKTQLRQLDHRTENVLDALKEISRKRIHAHEDYEHHSDQSKKIKTDELQRPRSSKRPQDNDELNQSLNTSLTQSSKKICVYDEYAASKSSSDMSFKINNSHSSQIIDRVTVTAKRKTTSTVTEDLDRTKQVKLVTTETQTEPSIPKDQPDSSEKETKPAKKVSPLRVFDAHPLENLRKNRLAALMGTLVGKEVVFQSQIEETLADKHPISILSTSRRHHDSLTEKHVHFDVPDTPKSVTPVVGTTDNQCKIPETSSQSTTTIAFPISSSVTLNKQIEITSAVTPTMLSTAPTISFGSSKSTKSCSFDTSIVPSIQSSTHLLTQTTVNSPSKAGGFKFNLGQTTSSILQLNHENKIEPTALGSSSSPSVSMPQFGTNSTPTSTPTFNFGSSSLTDTTSAPTPTNNVKSAATSATSIPTFGLSTTSTSSAGSALAPTFGSMTASSAGFGVTSSAPSLPATSTGFGVTNTSTCLDTTTTAATFVSTTTPSFSFDKSTPASISTPTLGNNTGFGRSAPTTVSSGFSFGASSAPPLASDKTTASSTFAFGSQLTTSRASGTTPFGFSTPSTPSSNLSLGSKTNATVTTTIQPTFGFGSTAKTTGSSAFGITATTSAPSSTFNFGSKPSSTPSFGAGSSTPAFGGSTTIAPTFGATTMASVGSSFGSSGATPSFNASTSTALPFGSGTSAPTFGSSSTNAPAFGLNTTTSAFGSTTPAQPTFGSTTASQPTFGNSSNMFGATTTASSTFGTPTTTTTSLFGSSATSTPTFCSGATSTPTFGCGTGSSANQPIFGVTSTLAFGTKPDSSINVTSSSMFGAKKDATFTFGPNKSSGFSSNTPSFGSPAPSNTFGSVPAPAFGQTASQPGSTTNVFGSGNSSTFADKTKGSTFGTPSSGFGSASTTPAANSPFGGGSSATSTFGFGAQPAPSQNKTFAFGSSSTTNQNTAPFAFGGGNNNNGAAEAPKPSFSFTGGTTSKPVFGASNTTSNAPTFGAANNSTAPSFGAPNNSAVPTFGNSASVPSFGASFGGPNPAAAAVAPNPAGVGMFNIGAGASSGRPRPVAKAVRRRT